MICKVCGEQKTDKRATSAEIPPITHTPTDRTIMGWLKLSKQEPNSTLLQKNFWKPSPGTLNLLWRPLLFQFKYNEQDKC